MLIKIYYLMHVSSLDLNMGCYHIKLSPGDKQICTIVLPWGDCYYQKLPMGICNSPDIFKVNISELFKVFDMVYI